MALKSVVDSLDEVQEAFRSEYKSGEDGKFYLDLLDDVNTHPKVKNLKSAFDRQKADNATLKQENATLRTRAELVPEDFDKDEYERLKANPPKTAAEEAQRIRQTLEAKHQQELSSRDSKIKAMQRRLENKERDLALEAGIDAAGVDPKFRAAVRAMLKERVKVEAPTADDGDYRALVETDMGPMPVSDYVKNWASTDEGKVFVSKPSGGDASGSGNKFSGENPWMKESRNLTKQQELISSNPARARELAQAAGVKPNW